MAGFLYYKPGHTAGITRELLVEWGLGYAFSGSVAKTVCMGGTPDKSTGAVFADAERQGPRPVKMDLEAQTWRKIPKSDCWVGMWNDGKPAPEELAKLPLMLGYDVKLADGHEWRIPLVRRFDTTELKTISALPCYMECDEDGNWHRGPVREVHAHLWDATAPVADALLAEYVNGKQPDVPDADIFKCITTLLAANYCVGPGELSLMHALTNEAGVHAACMSACDWPTFIDWSEDQKKSTSAAAAAGSIIPVGEAG